MDLRRRILVLATIILLIAQSALACDCLVSLPFDTETFIRNADVVFIGRVERVEEDRRQPLIFAGATIPSPRWRNPVTVDLEVLRDVKQANAQHLTVYTGMDGSNCGVRFEAGVSYIVLARRTPFGALTTDICAQTGAIRDRGVQEHFAAYLDW